MCRIKVVHIRVSRTEFNPSFALNFYQQGLVQVHIGEYQHGESSILKAFELSPADPELMYFHCVLYFACLGQGRYEEALVVIDKALRQLKPGMMLGFRAAVLGHLERGSEAKAALDRYLTPVSYTHLTLPTILLV